jgi:dipeptidyl aminopeptidase/acylaminoacyl peptidase
MGDPRRITNDTKRQTMARRTTSNTKRRAITPEDLTRFNLVSGPQVSPDGTRIVFVRKQVGEKNNYTTNLWIADSTGEGEPRQFTSSGKDSAPQWSPCGSQVAFVSGRDEKKPQIHLICADGGEARRLTRFPEGSIGKAKWSPDGTMLAVIYRETHPDRTRSAGEERKKKGLSDAPWVVEEPWYRLDGDGYFGHQRHALYIVDVATGEHRKLYDKDTNGWFDFDWSPDSKRLALVTNRDRRAMFRIWNYELLLVDASTGRLKALPGVPEGPKTAVRFSPDGKSIAYAGRIGRDASWGVENMELFVADAAKGKPRSLTAKTDYCLTAITLSDTAEAVFDANITWTPDSRRVLAMIGWHGEAHVASIPRRGGSVDMLTSGAAVHDMGNLSADGKTLAMLRSTINVLPEVCAGDVSRDAIDVRQVTDLNGPLLKELSLARPKSKWITADDGSRVHVWIMLPPGHKPTSRKKLPAVLNIHGGPHTQYGVGFFHEMQVLAAAGFAVFYSNPRGSKGYGQSHCAAIKGDWGNKDWIDVQAVLELMKSSKFVDASRMGCMGGSYGGYMTNWAIGHTNDFRAAITDRCVSNLVSMAGSSDFMEPPDDYWAGNFWDRPEARWEQSPIKYFGKVRTPTLIIHSEGDLRCNIEQSEQVFAALKIRNIPTRFVRYPRSTSHGMSRMGPPDMRLHRLHEILSWWDRYLRR